MRFKFISIILLTLQYSFAFANFSHDKCIKDNQSNIGMKVCSWKAYNIANERLESLYNKLANKYKNEYANKKDEINPYSDRLQLSQSSWIVYREASCIKSAASMSGGSGDGLIYSEFKLDMTNARIKELEKLMSESATILDFPPEFLLKACKMI